MTIPPAHPREPTGPEGPCDRELGRSPDRRGPDVLIDCELRAGMLLLVLLNIGDETALGVRMAFAAPLRGMGGDVLISELPIFRRLAMLRPGGRIEVPIDVAHGFFARKESPVVRVRVRYHDRAGARHCEVFRHDLGAFEGLPELIDGVSGISGSADAAGGTRGD